MLPDKRCKFRNVIINRPICRATSFYYTILSLFGNYNILCCVLQGVCCLEDEICEVKKDKVRDVNINEKYVNIFLWGFLLIRKNKNICLGWTTVLLQCIFYLICQVFSYKIMHKIHALYLCIMHIDKIIQICITKHMFILIIVHMFI